MFTERTSLVRKSIFISTVLVLFSIGPKVLAQQQEPNDQAELFEMSLEELMEVEVSVASRKESTQRESPGIVTVITREEIQKSGARDLVDILRLVPGFHVGYDTVGAYGVAVRGIWANEGKVLVLMDGVELNDDMYGSFQYGHHIPVDIVERIEIMRGPGSAMYGESAELGVISIKTIAPEKKDDFLVSSTYSRMNETFGRKSVTGFYGRKEEDLSYSVGSYYERGNFTDRTSSHYDYWGGRSVDLGDDDNSKVTSQFHNIGLNWGNLSVRTIIDRYNLNSPWPGYTMYEMRFYSDIVDTRYTWPISDNLSVTSRFMYKHQKPWNYPIVSDGSSSWKLKITSDKYTYETYFSYDMPGGHNVVGGVAYDEIRGRDSARTGLLEDGQNKVKYYNTAFYGEGFFKTPLGNLTVGGRHVKHNFSGSNFVPRVALTKVFGKYHVKGIYSKAYRNPNIMNIAYNPTSSRKRRPSMRLRRAPKSTRTDF
ncbi:MAG: TonB-dependent receptor plug domain-containing protein [Planctomycetota bacterium]|jgi:outer membrane receptor for ferrienterochelin and colicin